MTADDGSSRSVWLGPSGVLAADLAPRAFAVECSTLSYDWVLELASAAQAHNLRYIDAPVTGLPEHAAAGTLTLLVGADAADLEAATPFLGLDLSVVAEAIATGQAASPQVARNARRMVDNDHEHNVVFTPVLRLKDVEYALRFARSLGIGSPFGQLAASQLRQLCDLGHTRGNESKIIEVSRLERPER